MTFEEGAIQSLDEIYPGIFPFWHRCVLPATWLYRHRHPAVMTSQSLRRRIHRARDPPLRIRAGSRLEFSRRSARAAGDEHNSGEGNAVAFTIDGPRGPRYVAKKGPSAAGAHERRADHAVLCCSGAGVGVEYLG